jgi:hypothetical protein
MSSHEYFHHPRRLPKNAPGPFYSLGAISSGGEWCGDCLSCMAPETEAPALLAALDSDNSDTHFVRQPQTLEETEQASRAAEVCCVSPFGTAVRIPKSFSVSVQTTATLRLLPSGRSFFVLLRIRVSGGSSGSEAHTERLSGSVGRQPMIEETIQRISSLVPQLVAVSEKERRAFPGTVGKAIGLEIHNVEGRVLCHERGWLEVDQ